jgi:hypothetical protein
MMLASRIIDMIEDSGAAQTEVYLALGIVQAVLPALAINAVNEGDDYAPQQSHREI